jgi:urocanate hydratase
VGSHKLLFELWLEEPRFRSQNSAPDPPNSLNRHKQVKDQPPVQSLEPDPEIDAVHHFYACLAPLIDPKDGLGGKLLFAGELDQNATHLIRAANIAGAATLAASADAAALRQALREGVIDFLVTTLDESLRILKNEIRKRQPVAVAVSQAASAIALEMLDRGVQPDLLPPATKSTATSLSGFTALGARHISPPPPSTRTLLALSIPVTWSNRPAEFEALLATHIAPDDHTNLRWLHLSPRYLGHAARRIRSLECPPAIAAQLQADLG